MHQPAIDGYERRQRKRTLFDTSLARLEAGEGPDCILLLYVEDIKLTGKNEPIMRREVDNYFWHNYFC